MGYTMSNPFWDYSVATYRLEGVAPACLALQDTFDLDVNVLLYAAWLAHRGHRLTEDHLSEVESLTFDWRENMVKPLRGLRQYWRECPRAANIREAIKAVELRAEQQQQDELYALYQRSAELPHTAQCLRENLVLVASFDGLEREGRAAAIECLVKVLPP
jgi:uncharacterized protein (TIGR02444 family)